MKFWMLALLLATAGMGRASADPLGDLEQVRAAYGATHSVHAEITMRDGMSVSIDWIEPNKMHVSEPNGMQMVTIGNNRWVNMGGHWTALPSRANPIQTQMAMVRGSEFDQQVLKSARISDRGTDVLHGIGAHKYHLAGWEGSGGDSYDLWIVNRLPVQVVEYGADGQQNATITYSRYNNVPNFGPPM